MNPRFLEIAVKVVEYAAAAGLLAYAAFVILKKSEEPLKIIIKAVFTIPFVIYCFDTAAKMGPNGLFLVMVGALLVAIIWTPHLGDVVTGPLMGLFDGGNDRNAAQPFYFIANAKRKRGLYLEAVTEIRQQLKKFPNDYDGVMLLASIQAENLKDLPAAEITLHQFCESPKVPENRIAAAWTALADWQLQYHRDAASARASLEKIIARLPDSNFALAAAQRIAHLGGAEENFMTQHERPNIVVPVGVQNLGLLDAPKILPPAETDPTALAENYLQHLAGHPHDSEAREKLAVIYARDFRRLDLAAQELTTLIEETRHSSKQIAGWLNQLANFQIELGDDIAAVRATLEQIVERFPGLSVADIAQRRLAQIGQEFRGREITATVKLGVYEQNVGLKYGRPRR